MVYNLILPNTITIMKENLLIHTLSVSSTEIYFSHFIFNKLTYY